MTNENNEEITQSEFAARLDMSRQRINRHVRDGVIPTTAGGKIPWLVGLRALVEHLSETAAGRGGGAHKQSFRKSARSCEGAAGKSWIAKSRAQDEWVLVADVRRMCDEMCVSFRNRMLAIPSWISTDLPHLTRADLGVFERYIRDALTELADDAEAGLANAEETKAKAARAR